MAQEQKGYGKMSLENAVTITAEHLATSTSLGELFERAQKAAIAFIDMPYGITEIAEQRDKFLHPSDIKAATTQDRIQNAVHYQNFEGVPVESDEYGTLLQATYLREKIVRDLILATIDIENNKLNLNPTVETWLKKGIPMLEKFDLMQYKLWEYVVKDQSGIFSHFRKIQQAYEESYNEAHPDPDDIPDPQYAFNTHFKPLVPGHGDFLYTLPGFSTDGKIIAIPYSKFFEEELDGTDTNPGLIKTMNGLIDGLKEPAQSDPYAQALIAGHLKLRELLTAKNSIQLEKLAEEQDILFVEAGQITPPNDPAIAPLLMFPPMESYLGDWKMHVSLEYWMGFVDTRHQEYNQDLHDAQDALLEIFPSLGNFEVVEKSIPGMKKCKVVFYDLLRSGTTYKSYASNIPNRLKIRLEHGNIIDLDFSTFVEKLRQTKTHLSLGLDADTMDKWFSDDADLLRKQAIEVGLHEVGHSALIAQDTMEKLTPEIYSNLEEAKSDICGLVGGLHFYKDNPADLQKFAAAVLAQNVRGLTRWQDRKDRTHFHGNAAIIKMMIDTDIIMPGIGEKWVFDPDIEKLKDLQTKALGLLTQFAKVYQSRIPAQGQELIYSMYKEDDIMAFAEAMGIDTSLPKTN